MISHENGVFWLDTPNTSYVFRVTAFGHLEHIYYGKRLAYQDVEPLAVKRTAGIGSSVMYDESDGLYCLDNLCLEWSGIGRGDYRHSPAEIKMPDGSFTTDFTYVSHEILPHDGRMEALPSARGEEAETLVLTLTDKPGGIQLRLFYTVFAASDIIARRCEIENQAREPVTLRRLMSLMVDMPNREYKLVTFDGAWSKESHRHDHPLRPGMFVNESTTGASSNRHNPGFLLASQKADETTGEVFGFNLLYSGNHYGAVELSPHDLVRAQLGVSPHCFEWTLASGESFQTPQAVMSYSDGGFGGLSGQFHDFVNHHVVPENWQEKERPVLFNNWEACFFKFTQRKLLRMARIAKRLGAELFVLDDGWFGERNDDMRGLGDYAVNRRKLPGGLDGLAKRLRRMGLDFGLWFEPEMVNQNSDLYRAHPDWAIAIPGRKPVLGRNQMVLDLCRSEVRDYIVSNVSSVLDSADIRYVKWDMNRHISDAFSPGLSNQGEFYHRYILGLYEVLRRVFDPRPHILLESCSSGGNRFDLGILTFGPQVWASDCTDPVERLEIQGGLSYLYPPSTWGAHVSDAPHQQTLRDTPLSTRFNVAAFGCLGYEMDVRMLSQVERREIREQIAYYKTHRRTFQFGRFTRIEPERPGQVQWQTTESGRQKALTGWYQRQAAASPGHDALRVPGLDTGTRYRFAAKPQRLFVRRFGGLVRHIFPLTLRPDGWPLRMANRVYALQDQVDSFEADGRMLEGGVLLSNQFMGSGYTETTRLIGDFGSTLYLTEKIESCKEVAV